MPSELGLSGLDGYVHWATVRKRWPALWLQPTGVPLFPLAVEHSDG